VTLDYNERCCLDDALRVALEDWERTRDEYWSEGVADGELSLGQLADDLARAVVRGTTGLVRPTELAGLSAALAQRGFSQLADVLAVPQLRSFGLEQIEIGLAGEYSIWPRAMAERALELAPLVLEGEPSENVAKYLPRMARAYVLGLDIEVVIIARSVLEAAVREWFVGKGHEPPDTMKRRLDFLRMSRVITPREANDAWSIWLRGNRAIHEGEVPSEGAVPTLKTTLGLVSAIEGL
jgi:hypothetical protein